MEPVGLLRPWTCCFGAANCFRANYSAQPCRNRGWGREGEPRVWKRAEKKGKASSSRSPQPSADTSFPKKGHTQTRCAPPLFENKPRLLGHLAVPTMNIHSGIRLQFSYIKKGGQGVHEQSHREAWELGESKSSQR